MTTVLRGLVLLATVLLGAGCASLAPQRAEPEPPALMREFRGLWVATVANIDWPTEPGLSTDEQQRQLTDLLDRAGAAGFNAIVLQVRPAADVLYDSALEPWSEFLTGEQGTPPSPYYDPLRFAVEEAHARGLELHAWFNPFRAGHPSAVSAASMYHVSRTHPDWVRRYGEQQWMDPGIPAVREHSLQVILDVVRRYDIDGVHLDDYFYPYPVDDSAGRPLPFPDAASYAAAVERGEQRERSAWRRASIDAFVERMYAEVKAVKPHVLVGISPFGIWRPGHPEGVRGFDAVEGLHADARRWLQEGWLDYAAPQLYWPTTSEGQPFEALLEWWAEQNTRGRHLWPGLIPSRVADGSWPADELLEQVRVARAMAGVTGTIHFSEKALRPAATDLARRLSAGPYRQPALPPPSPWLGERAPAKPEVVVDAGGILRVRTGGAPAPKWWVVRVLRGGAWEVRIVPGARTTLTEAGNGRPEAAIVEAVSAAGVLSAAARWRARAW